jgi:hypothetical protein
MRATVAVVQGVARHVYKVLPENSVIVVEVNSVHGRIVNVRCGAEKLWMFARDLVERCKKLTRPEVAALPENLKLIAASANDDETLVGEGLLQDGI